MQLIRRQVVLPCCCAMLEPDVLPLQHRSCPHQDWEWWVSIWEPRLNRTHQNGWNPFRLFYSRCNFLYLQCFCVQFQTGLEVLLCIRENPSSKRVSQNGLRALVCWISDIAWDFWSGGIFWKIEIVRKVASTKESQRYITFVGVYHMDSERKFWNSNRLVKILPYLWKMITVYFLVGRFSGTFFISKTWFFQSCSYRVIFLIFFVVRMGGGT
jgi:hypothetical protein